MKTKNLTLLLIALSFIGYSQTAQYFENNPIWKFYKSIGGSCIESGEFNYYLSGDTMINSLMYKKLFSKGYMNGLDGPGEGCVAYHNEWIDEEPIGFLRQESKKIFYINSSTYCSETEILLYDFDKNLNDTINLLDGYCFTNPPYAAVVDSIDSVLINSEYRRILYITQLDYSMGGPNTTQIIEGIGTNRGLINMIDDEFVSRNLQCFSIFNEQVYPNTDGSCDIPLRASFKKQGDFKINICPNPFKSTFSIKSDKTVKFSVFDIYGRTINFDIVEKNNFYTINMQSFENGVYFLKIESMNEIFLKKIIKENP
jgi:hypothetical protein